MTHAKTDKRHYQKGHKPGKNHPWTYGKKIITGGGITSIKDNRSLISLSGISIKSKTRQQYNHGMTY